MPTLTTTYLEPTFSNSDLPLLDSDELLRVLLKSVPSAYQTSSPDRTLRALSEDELLADPDSQGLPPSDSSEVAGPAAMAESRIDSIARRGVLHKLGSLFHKLTNSLPKYEDDPHPIVKVEAETIVDLTDDDADVPDTEADASESAESAKEEEEDEIEVEYMLIAANCIIAPAEAPLPRDDVFRKKPSRTRRGRRAKTTKTAPRLTAPPVIKQRRHVNRLIKTKRKRRAVPGFA
ncbi:hypothetical protein PSEUBRA_002649 [Kalmanozyma brasiliensis GHG001]|uniref:uncharacterized protein n=1 Tax=Kalmanozyma brasiliensis (strain GHG001) TaxID=1365824 RepID=UPI002867B39B|nr:uncharacterized protein PSEUBRA_002649 [Kalmanozyma brasiliensis GHG001]KAF6767112.1 hypothetical protein PSEUBRA_002649 [Kalmanozyma brasiliensis GHG001]